VTLFEESSRCLGNFEKENFANFLNEFYDIFSHNVIARNCKFEEHVINVKDSSLIIKQVPCRILLQMRKEMNKIIMEMERQRIIEEFTSPWISPVKKKNAIIRFCVDYHKINAIEKGSQDKRLLPLTKNK